MQAHQRIRAGLIAAFFLVAASSPMIGRAEVTAATPGVREAYEATLRCFTANIMASLERRDAGDTAGKAKYEANAKRSFDGALKLGRILGYSNRQMNHDFDVAETADVTSMFKDRAYFLRVVGDCKGLGLM